jgi:microcystin degradation protein MlrC
MAARIAIAGISVEALIDSPMPTGVEAMQIYRGQALIDGNLWLIRGMVKRLREAADVEICPLLWATALPGGALTADNYEQVKRETLALLAEQGPFDGVCLANHGALEVEGLAKHGDTDFILAVRDAIGPDVPLAIAFDLHGNLTPEIAQAGTVFSALRTAPHRDDLETGYRAADQLLAVLERGLKPQTALVQIPMLIPGEKAVTHYDPAKSLYASLESYDAIPGVMQTILMVGFAWNDTPWTGMTAMVTTESDKKQAQTLAAELAGKVWDKRRAFVFPMETAAVGEGIARAAASKGSPVFLSDSGDNTTMGAPGDLTIVLKHLLAAQVRSAFVPGIYAPQTVRKCHHASVGSQIALELGSEHISAPAETMTVKAVVEAVGDELDLGGFQPYRSKERAWAKVRINDIVASFHEMPIGITTPAHFRAMNVDLTDHQIVVLKLGYLHPQLEALAKRHIMLLSPGAGDLNLTARQWQRIRHPMFPLDAGMTWSPPA